MVKKLLILGAFCSLSFGGIADDINKDKNSGNKLESMKKYIDNADEECRKIKFEEYSNKEYSLTELENFYESAENVNTSIKNLNLEFESEISKFLSNYKNPSERHEIGRNVLFPFCSSEDGGDDKQICYKIDDIEQYKQNIKKSYTKAKEQEEQAKNEEEIKKIIKNELYDQSRAFTYTPQEYTVEQYDEFLSKARNVWERIRLLNKGDELSMPTYFYFFNTEARYIEEVQKAKQNKIERMTSESKNNKAKKASIPKYKNWKNTIVPKFQKSLKVGDYVAGGIVWKVDGNLVVVDTGNRGLVSQRRDQTYPRVPQDLMPLFMDEITGVAKY